MTLPPRLPKRKRREQQLRCPAHLQWIRGFACSVPGCDKMPIVAAHVRNGTSGGTSLKPSDEWTISLCNFHHTIQHALGEPRFEGRYGIDMKALAAEFASRSPALKRMRMKEKAA